MVSEDTPSSVEQGPALPHTDTTTQQIPETPNGTSLDDRSMHHANPLLPGSEPADILYQMMYHASLAGPLQHLPESHPAHAIAQVRTALGHSLLQRGIELLHGTSQLTLLHWMLQPAFFPQLWLLAHGNPRLEVALQRVKGFDAWVRCQREQGRLPTQWGPAMMLPPEEGEGSTTLVDDDDTDDDATMEEDKENSEDDPNS
jgi:hypothetical protein